MRAFLTYFLYPFNWVFILSTSALVLYFLKKTKLSLNFFLFSFFLFIISSTSFVPNLLVENLEYDITALPKENFSSIEGEKIIMILGAGHSDAKNLSGIDKLSDRALGRLIKGISLYYENPDSKIVVSGFKGKSSISTAEVMAESALSMGVDSASIIKLETPRNTLTEAIEFATRFPEIKEMILVTDAIHMKRSVYLFRAAGLSPFPAPTNYKIKHGTKKYRFEWLPSTGHLENLNMAIHEYVGLFVSHLEKRKLELNER